VDRAVPGEEDFAGALGVGVVDVGGNREHLHRPGGEQPDVDAPLVVAVDEHDVGVAAVEHLVVEPHQRRAVLGLGDREHVGADVVDDPGGHADGQLVDRLGRQLHPADPVGAAHSHYRHVARLGLLEEVAPVLPQQGPRGEWLGVQAELALRPHEYGEGLEVFQHCRLV